ncbi:uncharacterized protein LOC106512417, partial [Austrofundulus limnaeus]|uniref:Uncharacterized protein LOC106512417 n=1 Tax=Austrofundulus limnaeus TaxID=52670 RepID=A0A2I4ALY4_AUSLI
MKRTSSCPAGETMMSKQRAQRSFGNGALRDQWERRAQNEADQCKQEAERKERSSLKVLFSKWNYHWSLDTNGDKTTAEESEFSRLTSRSAEEEKKTKIRFKIVPPPPKPKAEAPPPAPPPPRRSASPRQRRPKRKVEVDVFRLCWRESWRSLKPPKYLYLKARESRDRRSRLSHLDLVQNTDYKPALRDPDSEPDSLSSTWIHSWRQVKGPAQQICSEDKRFQFETLSDRKWLHRAEIGEYGLPVWAGTWKIMNFPFRQQKKDWDNDWPRYQQGPREVSDRFLRIHEEEAEEEPAGWEESWRLSHVPEDQTKPQINDVFVPGWRKSCFVSAAPPEEDEERQRSWSCCWSFTQQIRWRQASLIAHHRHANALDRKRKHTILFLTSQLCDEDFTEWTEAWKTVKGWVEEEEEEEEDVHDEDVETEEEEEDEGTG